MFKLTCDMNYKGALLSEALFREGSRSTIELATGLKLI